MRPCIGIGSSGSRIPALKKGWAMMNKVLQYAAIGAGIGLIVAAVFPSIGKGSFESSLNDMAFALGKQKPFLQFAGVGAAIGAVLALIPGNK